MTTHRPEDPAETARIEAVKRPTAAEQGCQVPGLHDLPVCVRTVDQATCQTCPNPAPAWHGPDVPPAEPAQPPTGSCGCTAEPRNWAAIGSEDFTQLECAPAGLTPEQTIRHHALTHAMTWIDSCGCGTPDDGDLWTVADQLANYIRDGSRP